MGDWFDGASLGMFVHWDHASQQGLEVSWPLVGGIPLLPGSTDVPVEQYHSSAATFDPVEWDPAGLARLARRAGMTYAVFTAKHHSGYAMFHTKLSDFSIEHSPYGRDIVAEFADAMRAEGIRVGIYFSLSDWHHPDYPAFTEADKPYRFGMSPPTPPVEQWDRYHDYMCGQLRELLTNYGTIDILWFDGGWERSVDHWRGEEVFELIRSLQPNILVNDRLPGQGDYTTPEQHVPGHAPTGRWETCMTMNDSWGYNPADTRYKSARRLVHTLCEVAGRGGHFLLNVSPTGTGAIPAEQLERIDAIAGWMERNGEAITGATPGLEPWQFYGPTTRGADGRLYLHLVMRPYSGFVVRGVQVKRVTRVVHVASGEELQFGIHMGPIDMLFPDPAGELHIRLPEHLIDDLATVIAVEIADRVPAPTA